MEEMQMQGMQPVAGSEKKGLLNLVLIVLILIVIGGIIWVLLDLSGVEEKVEEQIPVVEEVVEEVRRTEDLSVANVHFTIIDRYNIYSKQDEPTFCYTIMGLMDDGGIMSPKVVYAVEDRLGNEILNEVIVDNDYKYDEEFIGCKVLDISDLAEGNYKLKVGVQDDFDQSYEERAVDFRITQYPRVLIYNQFTDQIGDGLSVEYTDLVDYMKAGEDQIKKDNLFLAGQPVLLRSKFNVFSRIEVDEQYKSWIIQKMNVFGPEGIVVHQDESQDFITNTTLKDDIIVPTLIDTHGFEEGKHTVKIEYTDLYSLDTAEVSVEVEIR